MSNARLLIVEDNLLVGMTLKDILAKEGFDVTLAENGKDANKALEDGSYQLALVDMMLPDTSGRELLPKWREAHPEMPVVIVTAHGDIPMAVECLKAGAYDFLTKPVEKLVLQKTIDNALKHGQLSHKVAVLSQLSHRETTAMEEIIAVSANTRRTLEVAERVASSDFSCILITGESGTGKGLFAKSLHKASPRKDKPFVDVNCSALPATLVESELFGHKKGSFTDAKEDKIGVFDMADGGTLFLDEIGDMDVTLQTKLLKVIEDQKFRRIGGTSDITVNVAIIAATNQDLENRVASGEFRSDLYYRLNVIPLQIPPLRERREEIEPLCVHFMQHFARKFGKGIVGFTDDAMAFLRAYSWPGNVRELRNVVERGCLLTRAQEIAVDDLLMSQPQLDAAAGKPDATGGLPAMPLEDAERLIIQAAMNDADGNRNQAAKTLGIHRTTLYKKLEAYGIE